ncbi:MAG: lipoyl(octanoyl) transferase LipB [candidate division Zixibacteria bacterium]|nr:lipoyl(octanoyl) transferase LipB [candidate division Zixibacteria bacterium]
MCSRGHKKLFKINLGTTRYKDAWDLQKRLVTLRHESKIPDCLLVTEHRPVITLGRGSHIENLLESKENLAQKGIDLFEVERGGDITFHGPGQVVIYPIIDLNNRGRDLHQYLRDLEKVIINTLDNYGLKAGTKDGLTGVWAADHKLAAIGVAVSRWITYHGAALNVNTDLNYFKLINPCGITEYPVGSLSSLLKNEVDINKVASHLAENFADLFYYEMETAASIETILDELPAV